MKKILLLVTALFAIQSAVALAAPKSDHKGVDKDHQISVGNENAAKSGSTSDMKVVKTKENSGKANEHRQAKKQTKSDKAKKMKKSEAKETE